jgi:hypothetical protein
LVFVDLLHTVEVSDRIVAMHKGEGKVKDIQTSPETQRTRILRHIILLFLGRTTQKRGRLLIPNLFILK